MLCLLTIISYIHRSKDLAQLESTTPPPKTPYDERVIPVAKNK